MISIEMLPGGHGDALVVEYGSDDDRHYLLVDAGTIHRYEDVRRRLLDRDEKQYEAFVVTHVDEDHIGGAVELLSDADLSYRISSVWFNGYVHSERGGNVLGPVDGERLTRRIADGGFEWNKAFPDPVSPVVGGPIVVPSKGDLPTFELPGGATVYLLSPSGPKLKKMAKAWMEAVTAAHLVPGEGADGENRALPSFEKHVEERLRVLSDREIETFAGQGGRDGSAANGSSIAFILEHQGKRALLGADAHPSTLVASLKRFGEMKGEERVHLDLFKLPHHGSRGNVTTELLDVIDCQTFLISTDGRTFGHPDDAALARIFRASSKPLRIYCNYEPQTALNWRATAEARGAEITLNCGLVRA
ncbi:MAG: MBL fold metallo-hydrolase [Burkholderiaceae bacterium]